MHRKINQLGLELVKKFEGFSSKKYLCSGGCWTIGYGHKIKKEEKYSEISTSQAEELLLADLFEAEKSVIYNINHPLSDNQFSALVSFTFNLGGAALQRSSLRQKVNYGQHEEACSEFLKWIYVRGTKSKGLIYRRQAESNLYSK